MSYIHAETHFISLTYQNGIIVVTSQQLSLTRSHKRRANTLWKGNTSLFIFNIQHIKLITTTFKQSKRYTSCWMEGGTIFILNQLLFFVHLFGLLVTFFLLTQTHCILFYHRNVFVVIINWIFIDKLSLQKENKRRWLTQTHTHSSCL